MANKPATPSTRKKGTEVKSNFPTPWKPEKEGDTLEGTYCGYHTVADARGDTFKSHRIRPDGSDEFMGVSGAMIDQKMERIPKGAYIWVTYKGDLKTKNGIAKDFLVVTEEGVKLLEVADKPAEEDDFERFQNR